MAKRKTDPTAANQLDMFVSLAPKAPAPDPPQFGNQAPESDQAPANDSDLTPLVQADHMPEFVPLTKASPAGAGPAFPPRQPRTTVVVTSSAGWVDDEWWTLAMVCAYLKLGRKAVWERKRDTKLGFPQPVCLGSSRPRWRGGEVKAWAGSQR